MVRSTESTEAEGGSGQRYSMQRRMRQGSGEGRAEGQENQHFNYIKAIVFYLECKLMKLISLCVMNPLARQIIARGLDSASQFLAYCSRGEKQTGPYLSSRHYTWVLHQLQALFSPFQVTYWPFTCGIHNITLLSTTSLWVLRTS